MTLSDKTQIFAAPAVVVTVERGTAARQEYRFLHNFRLGRGDDCDVRFTDQQVSSNHAEVAWEEGQWWLRDLGSRNGTYLDGTGVTRAPLPPHAKLELASGGPLLDIQVVRQSSVSAAPEQQAQAGLTQIAARYFGGDKTVRAGEHTMLLRQAFHRVRKRQSRRYWAIIGSIGAVLIIALGALYYQTQRVKKLEELHAAAENVFYTAKALELQLARLQARLGPKADPEVLEMRREQERMEATYDRFVDELGISRGKLSEEEWLIYRVARLYGECTVSMPKGFVETVKQYIRYWRRTPVYATAIGRARANGYPASIREVMLENGMPPQFFYLALQESGFNKDICGPETHSGIAKGMWQFIPATAYAYHLKTGPLVDVRRSDPLDERHNVEKSTSAAAHYLHDLYQREAQASGLLVMACYNWKETRIRDMLAQMPENPRDRNFWKLLGRNLIPQETYDYVFSIVAATVIGENPRLFGYDFDDPIKGSAGN